MNVANSSYYCILYVTNKLRYKKFKICLPLKQNKIELVVLKVTSDDRAYDENSYNYYKNEQKSGWGTWIFGGGPDLRVITSCDEQSTLSTLYDQAPSLYKTAVK